MIEAELKARLTDPDAVRAALERRGRAEKAIYRDVYYDNGAVLDSAGRELRLRTIETPDATRHLLTFKDAPVDTDSQSKPEHETTVGDIRTAAYIVEQLGFAPTIELTKDCENYRFSDGGREFLATVARVPELDGTFLELETLATEDEVDAALVAARAVFADLGVPATDLTTELYTDAVRAARRRAPM